MIRLSTCKGVDFEDTGISKFLRLLLDLVTSTVKRACFMVFRVGPGFVVNDGDTVPVRLKQHTNIRISAERLYVRLHTKIFRLRNKYKLCSKGDCCMQSYFCEIAF